MLSARLDWFVHCCSKQAGSENTSELRLLSTDAESLVFSDGAANSAPNSWRSGSLGSHRAGHWSLGASTPITPRRKELKDSLQLPTLHHYPAPPGVGPEASEEAKQQKLLETYQDFVLDLTVGMYLTQLTSNRDYSDIHCQLMEDLMTLKLDQCNGRIIEFPLTSVSKVYRIVKNDDKWNANNDKVQVPPLSLQTEHIVVVEFMRRKLAFVFDEILTSQRFLMCMELLIRRAQQKQFGRALKSMVPGNGSAPSSEPREAPAKTATPLFATPRPVDSGNAKSNVFSKMAS